MTQRNLTRRFLLGTAAMLAGASLLPQGALAAEPLKVAGVYTVPVEQQWVSRIHKAAEAAQARGDLRVARRQVEHLLHTHTHNAHATVRGERTDGVARAGTV